MKKLAKQGIHHTGFVTNNFDAVIDHLTSFYGIDDVVIYDFKPTNAWKYGEKLPECTMKIALGKFGPDGEDIFEIIQPVSGKSLMQDFLDAGKSGFHHTCFPVDNFDENRTYFIEQGADIIFETETEDALIGYRRNMFVHDKVLDIIFEIRENSYFRK